MTPSVAVHHWRATPPVVSYVINNLLLNSPDFQCGCLCTQYTTPDGTYSWSFNNVSAPASSPPACHLPVLFRVEILCPSSIG